MEQSWARRAERVFLRNYYPARISLVRGEGCRVFDDAGKSYLDLVGGKFAGIVIDEFKFSGGGVGGVGLDAHRICW